MSSYKLLVRRSIISKNTNDNKKNVMGYSIYMATFAMQCG